MDSRPTGAGASSTLTGWWSPPARSTRCSRSSPDTPSTDPRADRPPCDCGRPTCPTCSSTSRPATWCAPRCTPTSSRGSRPAPRPTPGSRQALGPRRRAPGLVRRPDAPHPQPGPLAARGLHGVRRRLPGHDRVRVVAAPAQRLDHRGRPRARARSRPLPCRCSGSAPTSWSTARRPFAEDDWSRGHRRRGPVPGRQADRPLRDDHHRPDVRWRRARSRSAPWPGTGSFDHKTMFAIHLIPETTGRIAVGRRGHRRLKPRVRGA